MEQYVTVTSDKSKTVALLLCVFFGYLGLHYFYVGRFVRGLIALFTANWFGIGWIIDTFVIATGSFRDNAGICLRR